MSAAASRRAVLRQTGALSGTAVTFAVGSYMDFNPPPDSVVYCDPPDKGTTSYAGTERFDHDAFWHTCDEWARAGSHVFVSEYDGPGAPIWHRERDNGISGGVNGTARKAKEMLFYLPPS